MGTTTVLRGWLLEEMLVDSPSCLYPLQEPEGSTSFGDMTGQSSPATIINSKYGAGVIDAGGAPTGSFITGNVVTVTNVPVSSSTKASPGSGILFPVALSAATLSIEVWFAATTTLPLSNQWIFGTPQGDNGLTSGQALFELATDGTVSFTACGPTALGSVFSTGSICDGNIHHLVGVSDGTDIWIYVDGVGTSTFLPVGTITLTTSRTPLTAAISRTWTEPAVGGVAFAALYPTALSSDRILAHYNAGANAFSGERTDEHIARILTYRANTGSDLDTGLGNTGTGDCTGETQQQALLDCSEAEGGVLYANGLGQIQFRNRANNFNPTPVLTLDASLGQVDLPTTFADTIQNVVNDLTVSRPNGADQTATNAASIAQFGDIAQSITANVDTDQHALDLANWGVAQGSQDQTSSPTLTVNVFAQASSAAALGALQLRPLDCVELINLPGVPPSETMTVQVQGGSYARTSESLSVSLYTTPVPPKVALWDDPAGDGWDSPTKGWAY
jgi:hypothetical protein